MMLLLWIAESAVRLAVLAGITGLALQVLRVKSADTQLRVWTVVLLAALMLPFAPPQWVVPVNSDIVAPMTDFHLPIPITRSSIPDSQSPISASRFPIPDVLWFAGIYLAIAAVLLARLVAGGMWAARL